MSANTILDETIEVVGLVLYAKSSTRIAIFRRGPDDSGAGHWEFPGGKVDDGETKEQALVREIHEELAVKIKTSELKSIAATVYQYPTKKIRLSLFLAFCPDETIKFRLIDHDQFQWVMESELQQIDFSPADQALIPQVLSFLKSI